MKHKKIDTTHFKRDICDTGAGGIPRRYSNLKCAYSCVSRYDEIDPDIRNDLKDIPETETVKKLSTPDSTIDYLYDI